VNVTEFIKKWRKVQLAERSAFAPGNKGISKRLPALNPERASAEDTLS